MANNNSTDFIKINNEYVKFYATTNSALPDILKNTGALIVVQDDSQNDNETNDKLRSLYIAKNFIAEGHGFTSYTVRDYYDSYAKIENNGQRVLSNILDNLQFGIDTNKENQQRYVLSDGGIITNTRIDAYVFGSYEPYTMTSMYITYLLKPADYDKAIINNVQSYITYYYGDYGDERTLYSYAKNIDELNFNDESISREIIYDIPRGSKIAYAYLYGESTNNDTTGFVSIDERNAGIDMQPTDTSSFIVSMHLDSLIAGTSIISYEYNVNKLKDSAYFVTYNPGTHSSEIKKYPWLPNDIQYKSYENVIKPYTVNLGYVKCNIYDVIKSYMSVSNDNVKESNFSYNSRIYDDNKNYAYAIIDCSEINYKENGYVNFAVPNNYEVLHVYQMRNYNRKTSSYYEYNITGDVYELAYNENEQLYYKTFIDYYCKCNYYHITNKIKNTDKIHIELKLVDESVNYENNIIENIQGNNDSSMKTTSYFLQDSEYNSTHWMNPSEISYIQNEI